MMLLQEVTEMNRLKKGVSLLLICCMLLTLVPAVAFAAGEGSTYVEPTSGFVTEPMIAGGCLCFGG